MVGIDPKINSKVRIEENVEIKKCSSKSLGPKTDLEPYPDPKISP